MPSKDSKLNCFWKSFGDAGDQILKWVAKMSMLESWAKATTFQFVVNNMTQCDSILDLQWDSLDPKKKRGFVIIPKDLDKIDTICGDSSCESRQK
jgi:hypothetical protein